MRAVALILSLARRDRFGAFFPPMAKNPRAGWQSYISVAGVNAGEGEGGRESCTETGGREGLSHEKDILLKALLQIQDFLFVRGMVFRFFYKL